MDQVGPKGLCFRYTSGQRRAINVGVCIAVATMVVLTVLEGRHELRDAAWLIALNVTLGIVVCLVVSRAMVAATAKGLAWRTPGTQRFVFWTEISALRPITVGTSRRLLIQTGQGTWIAPVPLSMPFGVDDDFDAKVDEITRRWIAARDPQVWPRAAQPYEPPRNLAGAAVLACPLRVRLAHPLTSGLLGATSGVAFAQGEFVSSAVIATVIIGSVAWYNRRARVVVNDTEVVVGRLWSSQRIPRESVEGIIEVVSSGRRHIALRARDQVVPVRLTTIATTDVAGLAADPGYYRTWAWLQGELLPANSTSD